jgi:hypothetical protein
MSVLHAAVPLFFGLMSVEWIVASRRGRRARAVRSTRIPERAPDAAGDGCGGV